MKINELLTLLPELPLDEKKLTLLDQYIDLVLEANKQFNLTAIKDKEEAVEKHIYDCLLALRGIELPKGKYIDIGTGGGFPGMVYAILLPELEITLLDATNKKCLFLRESAAKLGLNNVFVINGRAEELSDKEQFDFATTRAVSSLSATMEVAIPLLKVGGRYLALRGSKGNQELNESERAVQLLGVEVISKIETSLPNCDGGRVNICFKKIKPTPNKYPRRWSLIVEKPL